MAQSSGRMAGKVAIVTGAASGIGRATAARLAREGALLVLVDIQEEKLRAFASELQAGGAAAVAVHCDVRREEQVRNLAERALALHGRIDILANVAGVTTVKAAVEALELEEFNRVTETNLAGTFLCVKHVTPAMKRQRYGRIVNVASTTAIFPTTFGNTAYTASKGGVAALTRQWVLELAPHGITVNAVAPGPTRTPMIESGIGEKGLAARLRAIPAGRVATVEDQAAAIAFFASDDASYVNGQMLVVDGGMTSVLNPIPA